MPDHNPYESPAVEHSRAVHAAGARRNNAETSVAMILVGGFFFLLSVYLLFGRGFAFLVVIYQESGWFPFAFETFYGFTGLFTAVFHLAYLLRGNPDQGVAGVYAMGAGFGLTALSLAAMEILIALC